MKLILLNFLTEVCSETRRHFHFTWRRWHPFRPTLVAKESDPDLQRERGLHSAPLIKTALIDLGLPLQGLGGAFRTGPVLGRPPECYPATFYTFCLRVRHLLIWGKIGLLANLFWVLCNGLCIWWIELDKFCEWFGCGIRWGHVEFVI